MDIVLTIVCVSVVIGVLVFIHEGGHYVAARAMGVRVTEFMIGLPGPSIGFTKGVTRFGVTAIPLGGYARVCGMGVGEPSPHLKEVLAALYRRGTANMEDIAADCGISDDEAFEALEQLVEWGSCSGPGKKDQYNTYRAARVEAPRRVRPSLASSGEVRAYGLGEAREVADADELFESEYSQQYCSKPFWRRAVILLAGVAMNLLFAVAVFVLIYSVVGVDLQNTENGEVFHYNATLLQSLQLGVAYIVMVVQAVANLFNPQTAAQTIGDSSSIVGIAVMSKDFFAAGVVPALEFMAMISVSLGVMNLLPVPPLDGGRFIVEVVQKATGKNVSAKVMTALTYAGMALVLLLFAVTVNQDIQRFVFGNWG